MKEMLMQLREAKGGGDPDARAVPLQPAEEKDQ